MSGKTMFCGKCGTPLQAGDKFCPQCGAPVPDFVQERMAAGDELGEPSEEQSEETPETSTPEALEREAAAGRTPQEVWASFKYLILSVAVAVAALIVILFLVLPRGVTLTEDYLDVKVMGYDGYGTVTWDLNTTAFARDYGNRIHLSRGALNEDYDWVNDSDYAASLLLDSCVDCEVVCADPDAENGYLSNEDQVVIEWNCDNEAARKYFKVRLKGADITCQVHDLPETEEVDVFAYIDVTYDGEDTQGTAEMVVSDAAVQMGLSAGDFLLSETRNLSNGDTVTVRVDEDKRDALARESGIVPMTMEKTYTVEGLGIEEEPVTEPEGTDASGEYLCDFSSDRLITDADMAALEASDYGTLPAGESLVQMIINEIYARHGYRFDTEEIQRYFEAKQWYQDIGSYDSDMDEVKSRFSGIEKQNVEYLEKLR